MELIEADKTIRANYQEQVKRVPREALPNFKRFLSDTKSICETVYDKAYLETKGYEFIHAIDLCEIIDYSKVKSAIGTQRSFYKNTVFTTLAINNIFDLGTKFTILPGTIYETLRFLVQSITAENKNIEELPQIPELDTIVNEKTDEFSNEELIKISALFDDISYKYRFLDCLIDAVGMFIKADNYVPVNSLIEKVPLGARKYRTWYNFLRGIEDRKHKLNSNIADAINLALIPSINANNKKTIVSLATRTPSFYRTEPHTIRVDLRQNFDDKSYPLFHKPATIVLSRIIDPYGSFSPEQMLKEVRLFKRKVNDIYDDTDQLSIDLEMITEDIFASKSANELLNKFGKDLREGRSEYLKTFYETYIIDTDYSLQTRFTNHAKKYFEPTFQQEDIDASREISLSLRLIDRVVDLGERLAEDSDLRIRSASRQANKPSFYYLAKPEKLENPLERYGYGVDDSDKHGQRRIELFNSLSHERKNIVAGLNYLNSGYLNFYVIKSKPLYYIVIKLFEFIQPNTNEDVTVITISRTKDDLSINKLPPREVFQIFDIVGDVEIETMQFEYNDIIITIDESKPNRRPFFSVRFKGKLPENYLKLYESLSPKIPSAIIRIFLSHADLI